MMRKMNIALWLSLALICLAGCKAGSAFTRRSSDVAAFDMNGHIVNPFHERAARAIVFLFVRTDCPISNRYAPEIERLAAEYATDGIVFWLIYPDASTSVKDIEQHRTDYHLTLQALRDPQHALVKLSKATVTPEAAVFLPDGHEVYRGRIDDRYVDFGKERPAPTTHDLDQMLKSVIGGKPITNSTRRAIGCYIE
jgi:hypothetical protein